MSDITIKVEKNDDANLPQAIDDDDICELEHLRKLFIGGLAPYTTEEGLKNYYSQWGKVVDVVVMRDPNTKRSRGFGFITFTKSAMVDKTQENRPHVIDGKTVEAKRALPRPERETRETNISVKKLFVGGLKDNHDEECLNEYFAQFGKVISVKLLTDKTTGKRRGFAFVEFDDYDAVDKAILQKTHSIKYVLVDVKKSIYNYEKKPNSHQNNGVGINNNNNQFANKGMSKGLPQPGVGHRPVAPSPQQVMPPYAPPHQQPPSMNAPPPNYNYWGPPPPMPQPYYHQPPPQMNGWHPYPPQNGGWNVPPPQTGGPHWQPNQWGCPPPVGPPQAPASGPVPQQVNGNWNMQPPPVAGVPPVPGQSVPLPNGAIQTAQPSQQQQQPQPPQQQQPPVPQQNFGTGYQQNYGGGPTKHSNINSNRMNPYSAPSNNNYSNNGAASSTATYSSYNGGPPPPNVNGTLPPAPVPKPVGNGSGPTSVSNNIKYRR